jgi:NADH-quinone oxidoreductase subunit H
VIPEIVKYLHSDLTPGEFGSVFWMTVYVLAIFGGTALSTMVMVWMERKILAHMQVRLGPMRVGPHGLLQPVADSLKLLIKEDVIPRNADRLVFWFAPLMVVMTAFTMYITLPFGRTHAVTDINIGILFLLGVSSLGVLGVIMGGWSSNSHYPLLGALRSSAQMVSYEIPMGLAVVSAVVMTSLHTGTGTLSMIGIVEAQFQQHQWFAFTYFPLGLIAFVVFAISMVAETNRAPFDLPEAESELVAGFMTEYSGFRWSLFFLAEYASMIAISAIAVTLWLGGWLRPFPNALSGHLWEVSFSVVPAFLFTVIGGLCCVSVRRMPKIAELRAQRLGLAGFGGMVLVMGLAMFLPDVRDRVQDVFWFVIKVAFFMYLYIWYRGTFPRYRFDQLMKVGWKVLLPIALGVLLLTATVGVWSEIWALAHEVMR